MTYPSFWTAVRRLASRLRYADRRQAYYEATAKNLEISAASIVIASEEAIQRMKMQEAKTNQQRASIKESRDTLSKLLDRTRRLNDIGDRTLREH